jgi:hypothetical protein
MPTNVISFFDAGRRRLAKQIAVIEAELELELELGLGLQTLKVMALMRTFPEMDGCTLSSSELYRLVQSRLRAKLIVEKNRK